MIETSSISIIIDILCTSMLIYTIYYFFRGTHTATIGKGLIICIILYSISVITNLNTITWLFLRFFNELPIIIAIIFHQEIRHFFSNLGRNHQQTHNSQLFSHQLSIALQELSDQNTGALIIIERNMLLNDLTNNAVMLDARFSIELIHSIFYKGTPLHDGAVIIRNEHILAAKVLLPAVFSASSTGTRHGVGTSISKERDCIVFIVSEETGIISYAKDGLLTSIPNMILEDIIHETIQ